MSEAPLQNGQFRYLAGGIPYGRLFAAAAVAVIVLVIAALVVAVIRWRRVRGQPAGAAPPLRLSLVAGGAVLLLCAVGAGSIHAARNIVKQAFALERAPWDAAYGIGVEIPAFPMMATLMFAAGLLWLAGLWFTLDARRRTCGGDPPLVAAIVALGLAPTIAGIWRWKAALRDAFDAAAGQPPTPHDAIVLAGTDAAGARLAMFARVSGWTIAGLAVVALVLVFRAHRRSGAPVVGAEEAKRRFRPPIVISAIALVAAAILFLAARPMRAENRAAWPPNHDDDLAWLKAPTPDLVGPDALERAPVVHVWSPNDAPSDSPVTLNEKPVARASLVDKLWTLRDEFGRRHPGEHFSGLVVAVISRDAAYRDVVSALRAIHDAGFPYPQFAFTHWERHKRPTFGVLKRLRATGARATLIDDIDKNYAENPAGGQQGTVVGLTEFDTYEALAGKLVELRRVGQPVILDLADLK